MTSLPTFQLCHFLRPTANLGGPTTGFGNRNKKTSSQTHRRLRSQVAAAKEKSLGRASNWTQGKTDAMGALKHSFCYQHALRHHTRAIFFDVNASRKSRVVTARTTLCPILSPLCAVAAAICPHLLLCAPIHEKLSPSGQTTKRRSRVFLYLHHMKVRIQRRAPSGGTEARREVYAAHFQQERCVRGAGYRNVHLGKHSPNQSYLLSASVRP